LTTSSEKIEVFVSTFTSVISLPFPSPEEPIRKREKKKENELMAKVLIKENIEYSPSEKKLNA
jgi:hypothetical protein